MVELTILKLPSAIGHVVAVVATEATQAQDLQLRWYPRQHLLTWRADGRALTGPEPPWGAAAHAEIEKVHALLLQPRGAGDELTRVIAQRWDLPLEDVVDLVAAFPPQFGEAPDGQGSSTYLEPGTEAYREAERAHRDADKAYQRAHDASEKACSRRAALPPGSTRARVTTANARWATAAEARDRIGERLDAEFARRNEERRNAI